MPKYKLVCFDVDGTLIDNVKFSWQIFHDYFQTDKHKREDAKRKFFDGHITYKEWAEHDINLWRERKAKKDDFYRALDNLRLMKGAMETLRELKKQGINLAIISGSLNILIEKFIPDYRDFFDYVFISNIYFDENGDIGRVEATEYDMEGKSRALRLIAEREGLDLKECAFVGDYLNDLHIIKDAGLGIAFNAEDEELKKAADVVIDGKDLREVLKYLL